MALSKNYLQLEFGSGHFFDYSKEEKDGYVKHVSTKGNTSYRKYYKDGVEGILDSVSIYDGKFGQQLSVSLMKEDEIYYLPVAIYDQKGQVDNTYAESLIKLLPQLEKGQNLTIQGYNFKPEDSPYSKIGFSIKVSGEKLKCNITSSYYKDGELVPGDVPALIWVEKLGKKKPSAASIEVKDEYLLSVLQREEQRLTWKKEDNNSETDNEKNARLKAKLENSKVELPAVQKSTPPPSEDDDDLPF